jgi:hypothetical protein
MNNVSIKLNLASLQHALMKSEKTGKPLLVIPIEENNLFKSEKGNIYLDLIAFPVKNPTEDQTHVVKQSLSKAVREKMTEEEQKSQPIIGNLKIWSEGGTRSEQEPNNVAAGAVAEGVKGLPF